MPPYGRGVPYQMPAYGMPMQRGGRNHPRGMPRMSPGGGGGGGNRNFRYTSNARNQPGPEGMPMGGGMRGGPPAQQQQQQPPAQQQQAAAPAAAPEIMEPLTPAALADADPQQQKNMIGERLYPLIHAAQPELAGKITGMLLEMDNGELLNLLESPEALNAKIMEAISVLQMHAEGDKPE